MMDDPLVGAGFGPADVDGEPFCPICGTATEGGRCRSCEPRTATKSERRAAEQNAVMDEARRERLAMLRRAPKNPLVWLAMAVAVAVEPMWALVFAVTGFYLWVWVWVAGVTLDLPPEHPKAMRATSVGMVLTIGAGVVLLTVAFLIGQSRLPG